MIKPVDMVDVLVTSTSGRCLEVYRQEIEIPLKDLLLCRTPYKSVFEREESHYIKRFRIFYKTTYRHGIDSIRGMCVKYFVTDSSYVEKYLESRGMTEIVKLSTVSEMIKGGIVC